MTTPAQRLRSDPGALDDLLRTGQVRRAQVEPRRERARLSLGVPALDAALGGGLPRGQIHEIVAAQSSGGTALLLAALGAALGRGEPCALIDPADAFDPRCARAAGLDLRRLLWVRPATPVQALRAAEIALEACFALVALDLADGRRPAGSPGEGGPARGVHLVRFLPPRKAERLAQSPWTRLSRRAEKHQGALLVLSRESQVGSFAATTVELQRARPRWVGSPGTAGRLLEAGGALVKVARSRGGAPSQPLALRLPLAEGE